ncbi:MAG: aromatic ring-hydroxylating dioxygenase subunit alpha [Sphingomonadaceae bacterium]|nr:aromatic ring-hydroxylating dioxygenase subunit alpha [Sphingomonadaceae bacterium]
MNKPDGQGTFSPEIFVPAEKWTSPERDAAEREKLWPKTWQMVCREDRLIGAGSFVTHDILDDPIIVIRTGDGDDDLSAMYNVCQHRGRRLVDRTHGKLGREITCRFHGWRFGWDGEVTSVFFEEDWDGCPAFDKSKLAVPQIRVARWGGFVFVNLDPDAESLESWLAPVTEFLDPFHIQDCKPHFWKRIHAPINWKTYIEAFNEGYHSGETHTLGINYRVVNMPGSAAGVHGRFWSESLGFSEYRLRGAKSWTQPETFQENLWANMAHQYDTLFALTLEPSMKAADRIRDLPAETPPEEVMGQFYQNIVEETEKSGAVFPKDLTMEAWLNAGTDWHIFPNVIILPSTDGALVYRSLPDPKDRDKAYVDIWSLGRFPSDYEGPDEPDYYNNFEEFIGACPFLEEDFANMEAVNAGMKSRGFKGATFNPNQEVQIKHFHDMLDKYCGKL